MNVAGMDVQAGNTGMANAALRQYQESYKATGQTPATANAAAMQPGESNVVSPVRPLDPATGRPVSVTEAGIPLNNPFARQVKIPDLGIQDEDTTLDVIARLSNAMNRDGVSVQAASRLYDVQQQVWESYKTMMQSATGR